MRTDSEHADAPYLAELRSALAHLDDPPYLEKHPLTQRLTFLAQVAGLSRGQALRRALRLGIAALDPGSAGGAARRLEARSFQVLYHWAICKESTVSIAALLGISRRQAYRELQHGIQALGAVLATMNPGQEIDSPQPAPVNDIACGRHVREELERLAGVTDQEVDLCHLLGEVVQSARRLAESRGLELYLDMAVSSLLIAANRVMLRQAILNLLSYIIGVHEGKALTIYLDRSGASAKVRLSFRRSPGAQEPLQANSPYALARELLHSLGIEWAETEEVDGETAMTMVIPLAQERSVLIVDDNEGLIALFRRYLRGRPYRVHSASSSEQALRLVDEVQPDIIIIDVMMPDRDGWELLQLLQARMVEHRPRTIVCSIVNDPRLAAALGADAFLSKPVDQASLLQTLASVVSGS